MNKAAMRACARIAWRQARRAPGRASLVITMIALPVAALTFGATLIRTSVATEEEHVTSRMGSAELMMNAPFEIDRRVLQRELPPGTRVVSIAQWNHSLIVDGSLVFASVFEPSVRIDQAPIPGIYELMDGRAPAAPGEAAVDPSVLDTFDVGLGDELVLGDLELQIVGVAARPREAFRPNFAVAPGTLEALESRREERDAVPMDGDPFISAYLIDLPGSAEPHAAEEAVRAHLLSLAKRSSDPSSVEHVQIRGGEEDLVRDRSEETATLIDDKGRLSGASFAATTLALFATGLIAAAAFAVGIRRQLRVLGLVGASGGGSAHVRAVVLFGGTTLGVAGAAAGIAIGLVGAYATVPHLHRFTHALPGPVDIHLPTIMGAGLLGVIAATAAAARPARSTRKISVLDALASRLPNPRPPGRLARRGILVAAGGTLLAGVFFNPGENIVMFTAGLVLMIGGFLVAVPWLVTITGHLAPLMPMSARIAVRDTARHGRRTGTAIAAAALALTTPIAVGAVSLSEEAHATRERPMGEHHLLIGNLLSDTFGRPESLPKTLEEDIARAIPGSIVVRLRGALLDLDRHPPISSVEAEARPGLEFPAYVEGPEVVRQEPGEAASRYRRSSQVMIGDAAMLRAMGAESGIRALEEGKVVGIGPGSVDQGTVRLIPFSSRNETRRIRLPAVEAGSTRYSSDVLPTYVVSREGARDLGFLPGPPSYFVALVAARGPLTDEQVASVRDVAAKYEGAYVQTLEDFMPNLGPARLAATAGAAVIALAVIAVVLALISAESRRDQAILVAVGAGTRTRRRIAGVRAGLVALLAGVIAVPAGFAPVAVVQWSRPDRFPVVIPWTTIAVVVLAVPLIAAAFGWLTSRPPKQSAMLQPAT